MLKIIFVSYNYCIYTRLRGSTIIIIIPYRTKVWREKSLANLANFTKSPNFIRQTSYNSTTIVSIVTFSPNFIRQIDCFTCFAKLFSRQTFVLYGNNNNNTHMGRPIRVRANIRIWVRTLPLDLGRGLQRGCNLVRLACNLSDVCNL